MSTQYFIELLEDFKKTEALIDQFRNSENCDPAKCDPAKCDHEVIGVKILLDKVYFVLFPRSRERSPWHVSDTFLSFLQHEIAEVFLELATKAIEAQRKDIVKRYASISIDLEAQAKKVKEISEEFLKKEG